jgi:hypothetical protein
MGEPFVAEVRAARERIVAGVGGDIHLYVSSYALGSAATGRIPVRHSGRQIAKVTISAFPPPDGERRSASLAEGGAGRPSAGPFELAGYGFFVLAFTCTTTTSATTPTAAITKSGPCLNAGNQAGHCRDNEKKV